MAITSSVKETKPQFEEGIGAMSESDQAVVDRMGSVYDEMVGGMSGTATDLMKGNIPEDVTAQVRQIASERASASGIGLGQAGRALTARDLGLTSLQLKQTGAELATRTATLAEARAEYLKNYQLSSRQLLEDIRRTDISERELRERSRQFNVTQNFATLELLSRTMTQFHELQRGYVSMDRDGDQAANVQTLSDDFAALMTKLRSTLAS